MMVWSGVHGLSMLLIDGQLSPPAGSNVNLAAAPKALAELLLSGLLKR